MYASILYGGITHHYLASDLNYCNRVGDNNFGTIHNEYVVVLAGSKKNKIGFIKGKDSVCGNIFGIVGASSIYRNIDLVYGGYNTNFEKFKNRKIIAPSVMGITPIIGFNFKIPIYEHKKYNISIDNIVSIGIITHAISINF